MANKMTAKTTLNPDMRVLTVEDAERELPKKIQYVKTVDAQLAQLAYGGPTWMALAKSRDAVAREANQYIRFMRRVQRERQLDAAMERRIAAAFGAVEVAPGVT